MKSTTILRPPSSKTPDDDWRSDYYLPSQKKKRGDWFGKHNKQAKEKSDQAGLNRRPLNLQSNALPLSYSRSCFTLMCSDYQLPDTLYRFLEHLLSPPMLKYFKRTKNWIYGKFLKFVLWFMRNVWNSSFVLTILSFLYKRTNLQKVISETRIRL